MSVPTSDRKFWLKLIDEYRTRRVLWDTEDKSYNDRRKRNAAYDELVEMAKVLYPNADVNFVKNRLISFRTCYKRELKKVKAAKENGTTYDPILFYFHAMRFLDPEHDDFEEFKDNWNTFSDDEDPFGNDKQTHFTKPEREEEPEPEPESDEPEPATEPKSVVEKNKRTSKRRSKRNSSYHKKLEDETENFIDFEEIDNTSDNFPSTRPKRFKMQDDFDMVGERIATHLRKMDEEQSLIAEKIISEVCINGRLRALTMKSYVKIFPNSSDESKVINEAIEGRSSLQKEDIYEDEMDF